MIKNANEVWKPIKGWEAYEVSNLGSVRSLHSKHGLRPMPRLLKPYPTPKGYLSVKLHFQGIGKQESVAKLVMENFNGLRKYPHLTIDHIDNNKINNRASNLQYLTPKENSLKGNSASAINARKTACPRGHSYLPDNLCKWYLPGRQCRICHNNRTSRRNNRG